MFCAILALLIFSFVILGMSWSDLWPLAKEHPGLVAVLIGVVGEVVIDLKEMVKKKQFLRMLFSAILVLGLGYEFREAAIVDKKVYDLELQLLPRTILPEQRIRFLKAAGNAPKKPVWLIADDTSSEGRRVTKSLRNLLDEAGFAVNGRDGAIRPHLVAMPYDNGLLTPYSPLLNGSADRDTVAILLFASPDVSNPPPHGVALLKAFQESGIKFSSMDGMGIMTTGEVAVVVP